MDQSLEIIEKYNLNYYLNCLILYNSGNTNHYHNFEHTLTVMTNIYFISLNLKIPEDKLRLMLIAGLFHDFNHSGGKFKNDSMNVTVAIEEFKKYSIESKLDTDFIVSIIKATQYPFNNKKLTIYKKIIRDSDIMQWLEDDFMQHVLYGLSSEMKNSNTLTIESLESHIEFMTTAEVFTNFAKKQMSSYLPGKIEDCEYLIKTLKLYNKKEE